MRTKKAIPYFVLALSITGCCKLFNCNEHCPPNPPTTGCCDKAPLTVGFTGGNQPGGPDTTTISVSDIAVIVDLTHVDSLKDNRWLLETAIAVDNGNNSTKLGDTHALIMLPADCMVDEVVATNPDGTAARWTQCQGYIDIELDQLDPDSARIGPAAAIAVYVHRSTYTSDCQPAFAVFAYSGMPDHVPGNNYWWWRKHCSIEGVTSHPTEQPLPTKQQR